MTDHEMLELYVKKLGGEMKFHHWMKWGTGGKTPPADVVEPCGGCGKSRDRHPLMTVLNFTVEGWGRGGV